MPLMHVDFYSKTLDQNVWMDVLLPTEHQGKCFPKEHLWPTLYLLHGLKDDHTAWQRWSSLERYLWDMPLAVIMPTTLRGFYTDMKYGPRYFTFLSEELPTICEKLFRLSPAREARFAAGLSMGGYGAFKLGLRCPEKFAAVASLSGALDVVRATDAASAYQSVLPEYSIIFGERPEAVGGDDDLFALAEKRCGEDGPLPLMYQCCGRQDMLRKENARFYDSFKDQLPLEYHEDEGEHEWGYWDRRIADVLRWLPLRERQLPRGE